MMLNSIKRFFAYFLCRKTKTIEDFVKIVKDEEIKTVEVGAKLVHGAFFETISGELLFTAKMRSDRSIAYPEVLFKQTGPGDKSDPAKLLLLAEQKVAELQEKLPSATVKLITLFLPGGIPININEKTRIGILKVATKSNTP